MIEPREETGHTTAGYRQTILIVLRDGREVGFITQRIPQKGFTHPWKAFRGIGEGAGYLGSFYREDGGKKAAIATVTEK